MTAEMTNLPDHLADALAAARGRCTHVEGAPSLEGEYVDDVVTMEQVRQRRAAARRAAYLRRVPVRFAEASLGSLHASQGGGRVHEWLSSSSPTLILTGGVGSGKTWAAYAVLAAALERRLHVAAATLADLLEAMRPSAPHSPLPRLAEEADVFLFDDVGTEKPSEWVVEQVGSVVDARTREGKRQIVTTNLTSQQLRERFGDRTLSRLSAGATVAAFEGGDRRRDLW